MIRLYWLDKKTENNETMYVFLIDNLVQTLDPSHARELQDTLNNYDVFELTIDDGLQDIINTSHHLSCLTHVIQLDINAFLHELKIKAKNDDIVDIQWNENDKHLKKKEIALYSWKDKLLNILSLSVYLLIVHTL